MKLKKNIYIISLHPPSGTPVRVVRGFDNYEPLTHPSTAPPAAADTKETKNNNNKSAKNAKGGAGAGAGAEGEITGENGVKKKTSKGGKSKKGTAFVYEGLFRVIEHKMEPSKDG